MTEPHLPDKGELEYGSVLPNGEDWRLRKFDAGMGEHEYRIFKNEKFFAMFDNRDDADIVMGMMTCPPESSEKVLEELKKIKGSFKVIELKRSDEYKEVYDQIVELIINLRQQEKKPTRNKQNIFYAVKSGKVLIQGTFVLMSDAKKHWEGETGYTWEELQDKGYSVVKVNVIEISFSDGTHRKVRP